MNLRLVVTLFLLNCIGLFSQENTMKHTIVKGETVFSISEKYGVKPDAIFKLNPKAKKLLKLNSVLIIPNSGTKKIDVATEVPVNYSEKEHEVLAKETLYSIAKHYGIAIQDLKKANPIVGSKGLKLGQKIVIPGGVIQTDVAVKAKKDSLKVKPIPAPEAPETRSRITEEIMRKVLPKESKYSISRKYGITIKEFEKANPSLISNTLKIGQEIIIPANALLLTEDVAIVESNKELIGNDNKSSSKNEVVIAESNGSLAETDINNEIRKVARPVSDENFSVQLIETASMNLGTRYRTGGTTKAGFDCSGLMCVTFGTFDIKLPRTSFDQSGFGERIDAESAQKGDLIFFKTNGRSRINHVGMVVEVNAEEIKFIHSSVQSGVIISSTKESYYKKRFAQVNRVF
jgi:peptidoglycan endopeptidase LytE